MAGRLVGGSEADELRGRVDRLERFVRGQGAVTCPVCWEWVTWKGALETFRGQRCFKCVLAYLEAMQCSDGPEWDPFVNVETREETMLELARIAAVAPAARTRAKEALACVDEPWVQTAWTVARLKVEDV